MVEYRARDAEHADAGSARLVLRMPDDEDNHNGGPLALRPRPPALHRHRRRRRRRRPAREPRQRPGPGLAAGQDPADRPAGGERARVLGSVLEPVHRALRRPRRDLQLRPAQPVAVLVRPPDRGPLDRRRRAERLRGDRLGPPRPRARGELRLAPVRGPRALRAGRAGAGPRAARDRPLARRRQLLDHRRRRRPRRPARPVRALRVRRLLRRGDRVGAHDAGRRPRRPAHVAARRRACPRSARTPRAASTRSRSAGRCTGSIPADRDGGDARPGGQPLALHARAAPTPGSSGAIPPGSWIPARTSRSTSPPSPPR